MQEKHNNDLANLKDAKNNKINDLVAANDKLKDDSALGKDLLGDYKNEIA